jgi:hypothetical protein
MLAGNGHAPLDHFAPPESCRLQACDRRMRQRRVLILALSVESFEARSDPPALHTASSGGAELAGQRP